MNVCTSVIALIIMCGLSPVMGDIKVVFHNVPFARAGEAGFQNLLSRGHDRFQKQCSLNSRGHGKRNGKPPSHCSCITVPNLNCDVS